MTLCRASVTGQLVRAVERYLDCPGERECTNAPSCRDLLDAALESAVRMEETRDARIRAAAKALNDFGFRLYPPRISSTPRMYEEAARLALEAADSVPGL